MDSSYYRHGAGFQPQPAGPQLLQLTERHPPLQQQQDQQQQQHQQQQHAYPYPFASPILQQQQDACSDDACSARQYLVSAPSHFSEQQQQQRTPLVPFSVTHGGAPPTRPPLGSRGWLAELRLAAAAAASALQQIKENPARKLLLFVLVLSCLCLLLLHARGQPESAATRLTVAEAHGGICDHDYRANTLKLAHEASAFSLLAGGWPQRKFEASDVVASNKALYFVCDSSFALMKTGFGLQPLAPENLLIGKSERNGKTESQWEALWLDEVSHTFFVMREAVTHKADEEEAEVPAETEEEQQLQQLQQQHQHDESRSSSKPFHAHIEEIKVHGADYTLQTTCKTVQLLFFGASAFLQGVVGFRGPKGEVYLLGLCEGNFCEGGSKGRTRGNGRMVLMTKETSGKSCKWKTLRVLELPSEIEFSDYSSVTTRGSLIAIASQEDSRLWLGRLNLTETTRNDGKPPTVVLEDPAQLEVLPGKHAH
ncbi:hypothetical protein Efla_002782 [Eimeria flavescens]